MAPSFAVELLETALFDEQPAGLNTRFVEAGYLASFSAGRTGRRTSSPPQLGHLKWSFESAHAAQNVHSKVQMYAWWESGGKSTLQHSQPGLSSSMTLP